jgi:hypothetical protein
MQEKGRGQLHQSFIIHKNGITLANTATGKAIEIAQLVDRFVFSIERHLRDRAGRGVD